jgi:hypothetical protein
MYTQYGNEIVEKATVREDVFNYLKWAKATRSVS